MGSLLFCQTTVVVCKTNKGSHYTTDSWWHYRGIADWPFMRHSQASLCAPALLDHMICGCCCHSQGRWWWYSSSQSVPTLSLSLSIYSILHPQYLLIVTQSVISWVCHEACKKWSPGAWTALGNHLHQNTNDMYFFQHCTTLKHVPAGPLSHTGLPHHCAKRFASGPTIIIM